MSNSYLLDTSVLILSLQKDQAIRKKIAEANMLYTSTIALGELYFGAEGTLHAARNRAEINELAKELTILNVDAVTARFYGYMRRKQERIGQGVNCPKMIFGLQRQQCSLGLRWQHVISISRGLRIFLLKRGKPETEVGLI